MTAFSALPFSPAFAAANSDPATSPVMASRTSRSRSWSKKAASADLRDERFPLADLVGLHPRQIFEHRRFERIGIVALVENGAGNGPNRPALTRDRADGGNTPTPRDNLVMAFRAVWTDEQRNQHPARANARHKVCDVGVFPLPAHVGGCDGQVAQINEIKLRDFLPSLQPHPAPDGRGGRREKVTGPRQRTARTRRAATKCRGIARLARRPGGPIAVRRLPRCPGPAQRRRRRAGSAAPSSDNKRALGEAAGGAACARRCA